MTSTSSHQYACTKCFNWFQFEQLTKDSQLCQECSKGNTEMKQVVNGDSNQKKVSSAQRRSKMRCKFCRTELQEAGKTKSYYCERCAKNKAEYGEPRNCSLCNLTAAFIGSKCRRCASSMKKYGPPKSCQQCKLKAAFSHPKAQIDGRTMCWLCASTAHKALRKVKRRASEEGKVHRIKKSKIMTAYAGGGSSPTELVIEEEIIQEKDSDQGMWDDFHDMDYRIPPSAALVEKPVKTSVVAGNEVPLSLSAKEEQVDILSSSPTVDETERKHKCEAAKNDAKSQETDSKLGASNILRSTEKHKLIHKQSRRSAPPTLKSSSRKHTHHLSKSGTKNHKPDTTGSTSKLLDAKILRLQKKLSHKKEIDTFAPNQKATENDKRKNKTSENAASKEPANQQPSTLSNFKVTESAPSASLAFDRFRTSDSASSSPLPVVNDGNIVLVTQLRAEISGLKKQISKKDQDMIEKDKQISCIKVEHLQEQRALRAKMKELISKHAETLEQLQSKNQELLKKISQLSKGRA